MAVTKDDVYESFPEFDLSVDSEANADQDSLVDAKIAEAETQIARSKYPSDEQADVSVKYLTAHLLALSPAAQNLRLVRKDGSTLYWLQYERLARRAGLGLIVP